LLREAAWAVKAHTNASRLDGDPSTKSSFTVWSDSRAVLVVALSIRSVYQAVCSLAIIPTLALRKAINRLPWLQRNAEGKGTGCAGS